MKRKSMVEQCDGQIDNMATQANVEQIMDEGNTMPDRCRNLKHHALSKGNKLTLRIVSDWTRVHKGVSLSNSFIQCLCLLIGLFAVLKFLQYVTCYTLQKTMRETNNPWCSIQTVSGSGWHVSLDFLTRHIEATYVSAKFRIICSLVPVHALLGCSVPSIVQAKMLFQGAAKHKCSWHSNPLAIRCPERMGALFGKHK